MFSVKELVESNCLKSIPSSYICLKNVQEDSIFSEPQNIPTIDFSQLISLNPYDRSKEIQKLGDACRDWGFFMLINHGVSVTLRDELLKESQRFFDLTEEEKREYAGEELFDPIRCGTSFNVKVDKTLYWRDYLKCYVHPHFHAPSKPLGFSEKIEEYVRKSREVIGELLRGISKSLGQEENYIHKKMNVEWGSQLLVINYYPPCPKPELVMGLPPHTDHGLLTLLMQNELGGLQIEHDGQWIPVHPLPNSFVINVGDHLEILTNGKYKSIVHRAVVNSKATRISIGTAHGPTLDTIVSPTIEPVSMYKIIAKVLASRLKGVLDRVISKSQSAFIKGRQILDGVVIANEIINVAKKKRWPMYMFKVDFEKAYDSVSWKFLDYMMVRMGFNHKWREWMQACVFNGSVSVLVNGSPTSEFAMERGLRQGDPLAPFLFLIIAEGLSGIVKNCVERGYLEVVNPVVSLPILQYADDTLLLCKSTRGNLWCMKAILRVFEMVSGLKVNFSKSCLVGLNVEAEEIERATKFLYCKKGDVPFSFLGIPIGANPRYRSTWKPVIEKLRARLTTWRSRQLSMGGRITLIKSVLASLPLYYFSFFKAPKNVIKEMTQIQRNFLWGGTSDVRKTAWVSWKKICAPKEQGGLGIKDMELFNLSLIGKWRWRMVSEKEGEWNKLLDSLYGCNGVLKEKNSSIWWKDLNSIDGENSVKDGWFSGSIKLKLGDGEKVRFWTDLWCGPWTLKELFSNAYAASLEPYSSVADAGYWLDSRWNWNLQWQPLLDGETAVEVQWLLEVLRPLSPDLNKEDTWVWLRDISLRYKVKTTYDYLVNECGEVIRGVEEKKALIRLWQAAVPSKVQVMVWRLFRNGLPLRVELVRRGVLGQQQGQTCVLCFRFAETAEHLFSGCCCTDSVWTEIGRWCGAAVQQRNSSIWSHFLVNSVSLHHKSKRKYRHMVWLAVIWVVWTTRNRIIFKGGVPKIEEMVQQIKTLTWSWFLYKIDTKTTIKWEDWQKGPLNRLVF